VIAFGCFETWLATFFAGETFIAKGHFFTFLAPEPVGSTKWKGGVEFLASSTAFQIMSFGVTFGAGLLLRYVGTFIVVVCGGAGKSAFELGSMTHTKVLIELQESHLLTSKACHKRFYRVFIEKVKNFVDKDVSRSHRD
jgi:hypothetical protein